MAQFKFFLLIVCFGVVYGDFPTLSRSEIAPSSTEDTTDYRLPENVIPSHYIVTLEPFFEGSFNFSGTVEITADANETKQIKLHANQLIIDEIKLTDTLNNPMPISSTEYVEKYHFLVINTVLFTGPFKIIIKFRGFLNEDNRGFYRAGYTDPTGKERWMATTQFEATDARRAFPCFDEPHLKATFQINLIRTEDYTSLSNTPRIRTEPLGLGRYMDIYNTTNVMSTYLLAFVVSQFNIDKTGIHEVVARPNYVEDKRTKYALELSSSVLTAMETFTGIKYDKYFDKITQIAIPDDWFASGAMENWGLVTYKERYLLYKDGLTTAAEKQRIAMIIAHEYGHQWFGNLVSPKWWNYIWLNEGFATYFEHYAADKVEPTMRLMEQYVTLIVQYSMDSDSFSSTRPITTDAYSPTGVRALFDTIAYEKAGSVIRMMEHFVGTPKFIEGLNKYLIKMELSSAVESDLYSSIQETNPTNLNGATVETIMKNWTLQAGHPVVTVTRNSDGKIKLTQKRFILDPQENAPEQTWLIPITWATDLYHLSLYSSFDDTTTNYWLTKSEEVTSLTLDELSWIVLNKQQVGYYRVNYEDALWNKLIDALKKNLNVIPAMNRAQILDDAFYLARADLLNYDIVLSLLEYTKAEEDYIPLYALIKGITYLIRVNPDHDTFNNFFIEKLEKVYKSLGVEDKGDVVERLNRAQVLYWMCKLGYKQCKDDMTSLLNEMDTKAITPDLQTAVYCGAMIDGNRETFDKLWKLYRSSSTESLEKSRIVSGLACSRDRDLLNLLLSSTVLMSSADQTTVINSLMSESQTGLELVLDFMEMSYDKLKLTQAQIETLLKNLAARVVNEKHVQRMENFLDSLKETSYNSIIDSAKKSMVRNQKWISSHKNHLSSWFDNYYKTKSNSASFISVNIFLLGTVLVLLQNIL